MEQNSVNIDYKQELKKALSIIETQSSIILQSQATIQQLQLKIQHQVSINEKLSLKQQDLEFQLAQLKKLVFGSRHEKFVAA